MAEEVSQVGRALREEQLARTGTASMPPQMAECMTVQSRPFLSGNAARRSPALGSMGSVCSQGRS